MFVILGGAYCAANMAGCLRAFTSSSAVSATVWKSLLRAYPAATVYRATVTPASSRKQYSTIHNPLERRTMKELVGSVGGKLGGRAGKGRKKGGLRKRGDFNPVVRLGEGRNGVRWPGLSYPLPEHSKRHDDWLQADKLGIKRVDEAEDNQELGAVDMRGFSDHQRIEKRESELNWSRKGWSGRGWRGRYVGYPETPNGTCLTEFKSIVIEMKRVANQTAGGKKKTVSCLVVVGNGNGAVGFAVGKGETVFSAIRKAKMKAVNYLQYVPRCDEHTIYHNIHTKFKRTSIVMEKTVKGHGLRCQRAIVAICNMAGIEDMRAKITGSPNPLNIVRATFNGLTKQETHQQLADRTGQYLVEYREECGMRPVVIAVPRALKRSPFLSTLRSMQMLPQPKPVQQPTASSSDAAKEAVLPVYTPKQQNTMTQPL